MQKGPFTLNFWKNDKNLWYVTKYIHIQLVYQRYIDIKQ